MIICKHPLRIVATILARNEEDIIGLNLEHHINQGVSLFIVTDNNSTDRTKEIVSKYKEVVELIDETENDHSQSRWVTRMARLACKFNPDWIIHLDADELWCGLASLRTLDAKSFSSTKMLLHPPQVAPFTLSNWRYYLDFESVPGLVGESKVGHRPNPEVEITHGNHGFNGMAADVFTKNVWRHHYPIRSYEQFSRKTIDGHESLSRRNSVCQRWKNWYDLCRQGKAKGFYDMICESWLRMIQNPNYNDLTTMMRAWSTEELIDQLQETDTLPSIGEWPKVNI